MHASVEGIVTKKSDNNLYWDKILEKLFAQKFSEHQLPLKKAKFLDFEALPHLRTEDEQKWITVPHPRIEAETTSPEMKIAI